MSVDQRISPIRGTLGAKSIPVPQGTVVCDQLVVRMGSHTGVAGGSSPTGAGFSVLIEPQFRGEGNIRPAVILGGGIGLGAVNAGQVSQFDVVLTPESDAITKSVVAFNDGGETPLVGPNPHVGVVVSGNRVTVRNQAWVQPGVPVPWSWWGTNAVRGIYYPGSHLMVVWNISPNGAPGTPVGTAEVTLPVLVATTAWGPVTWTHCHAEWGTLRVSIPYLRGPAFPGRVFADPVEHRSELVGSQIALPITIHNATSIPLREVAVVYQAGDILKPPHIEHAIGELGAGGAERLEQNFECASLGDTPQRASLRYEVHSPGADRAIESATPMVTTSHVTVTAPHVAVAVKAAPNPCRGGDLVVLSVDVHNTGNVEITDVGATLDSSTIEPSFTPVGTADKPIAATLSTGETGEIEFELRAADVVAETDADVRPQVHIKFKVADLPQEVQVIGEHLSVETIPPGFEVATDRRTVSVGEPLEIRATITNRSSLISLPESRALLEPESIKDTGSTAVPDSANQVLECTSATAYTCPPLGPTEHYTLVFGFYALEDGHVEPSFQLEVGGNLIFEGVKLPALVG